MKRVILLMVALLTLGFVASAQALELPNPNAVVDGVTLASHYTDFYTFPTSLMVDLIENAPAGQAAAAGLGSTDDWEINSGEGVLDLLVYCFSNQNNDPVSTGATFPDPVHPDGPNDNTVSKTWGNPDSEDPDGVTVGQMLAYTSYYGSSVPVFGFDMSESQGGNSNDYAYFWGQVRILDGSNNLVDSWVLKADPSDPQYAGAPGYVLIPDTLGVDGIVNDYEIKNGTTGGGFADYVVFAPDMVLTNYNPSYKFLLDVNFAEIRGGKEDIFLANPYFTVPGKEIVPEPASLSLLGLGLLGLLKRKRI